MTEPVSDEKNQAEDLEQLAGESEVGLIRELVDFLLHNKKWWLTPIILVLVLVGGLLLLGGTAAAPFIYTLF